MEEKEDSKSFEISFKTGVRMIAINRRPVTILIYFCMLELGRSMSITVASRMNMIILVTHSIK
jgi:hypothetical protein